MNRHQQLKEIKDLRKKLVNVMGVYSKDMKQVLLDLYQQTPTPSYDVDISDLYLPNTNPTEFMFKILKHMTSSDMTKAFTTYMKKREIFNDKALTFNDLVSRVSYLGRMVDLNTFGDGKYIRKYLPNLDGTLFELITVYLYSIKSDPMSQRKLFINRFNYILEEVWDLHIVDEASKSKFLINYDKLNDKLKYDGFNDKIKGLADIRHRGQTANVYDINTYIVAYLLLSEFLHDAYAFNGKLKEIHSTDCDNYEQVLDNLGMNYVKHDDIIKLAKLKKEDRHERSFN